MSKVESSQDKKKSYRRDGRNSRLRYWKREKPADGSYLFFDASNLLVQIKLSDNHSQAYFRQSYFWKWKHNKSLSNACETCILLFDSWFKILNCKKRNNNWYHSRAHLPVKVPKRCFMIRKHYFPDVTFKQKTFKINNSDIPVSHNQNETAPTTNKDAEMEILYSWAELKSDSLRATFDQLILTFSFIYEVLLMLRIRLFEQF